MLTARQLRVLRVHEVLHPVHHVESRLASLAQGFHQAGLTGRAATEGRFGHVVTGQESLDPFDEFGM